MRENYYLCGFMGCGKSTYGKQIASIFGYDFIDLDEYIEKKENMSIPSIFQEYGEEYFRNAELEALTEIASKENVVVALGGGALSNIECQNAIKSNQNNKIVFLATLFKVCYRRIKDDVNRPLVKKGYFYLMNLYQQRLEVYANACDYIVAGKTQNKE